MDKVERHNFNIVVHCVKYATGADLNALALHMSGKNVSLKEKLRTQEKIMNHQSTAILIMYERIAKLEEKYDVKSGKI